MRYTLLLILPFLVGHIVAQPKSVYQNGEYTRGVFFVNEDWYGHQNGSVNFLSDDGEWTYRIFRKANEGKELGCTTQFGTIYGDKFYIVSKQDRDPGAQVTGSRFTICDAKTLKCLKEFQYIAVNDNGKSIADGRSFVGVSEKKGYIGTSNGIWVYDMENMEILRQIEGTGNPNQSGYGQLYYAQIGNMLRTEDYVFAVHQQYGLLVVDPDNDTVLQTIAPPTYVDSNGETKSRGFGSIIRSKDGNLWLSIAANTLGSGQTIPAMLRMNPYTFEMEMIAIPVEEGIEDIPNSWYAWTADGFCGSTRENKIYWNGNNGNSWFKGRRIFCYDIDSKSFSKVYDFEGMEGDWVLYGAGFRVHPVTNDIYCSLFHNVQDPTYEAVCISSSGNLLHEYPLITNYWFPSMPVFPDNEPPAVKDIPVITCGNAGTFYYSLQEFATDADNMEVAIVKTVISNMASGIFEATVVNGKLKIASINGHTGSGNITIRFNSNGKIVDKEVKINVVEGDVGIDNPEKDIRKIYYSENSIHVVNCEGYSFFLYNTGGQKIRHITVDNVHYMEYVKIPAGVYILCGQKGAERFNTKIIIR